VDLCGFFMVLVWILLDFSVIMGLCGSGRIICGSGLDLVGF